MVLAYRNPVGAVPDDAFILLARRGGVQSDQSVPHIRVRDLGSGFMIHTAALNKQNEFFSSVYASPATLQINYQGGNSLAQGPWYVDTQMTNLSLLPLLVPRSPVPDLGCNSLVQGPWSVESVATLPQPALAIARPESCNQPQCSLWHCVLADQGCNSLVQGPWFCKSRSRCLAFESNFRFSPLVKSCFPVTDQGCNSLVQGPWSANSVALLQKPAVAARLNSASSHCQKPSLACLQIRGATPWHRVPGSAKQAPHALLSLRANLHGHSGPPTLPGLCLSSQSLSPSSRVAVPAYRPLSV